jgi:DNA-binding winged helix-turn-helix (wHTH) protein/TolB-like protein
MPIESADAYDICIGDFLIVRADERVIGPDGPVKLGRKAYRLLLMLAERNGQLLTKDALFESVWDGTVVTESALTSVIKELRRALDDPSVGSRYIQSVYGRGYRLVAPVERRPPAAVPPPASPAHVPLRSSGAELGAPPSVLMLPFDDSAIAAAHPHFGAVLHEKMIIALSRFREIRVVFDEQALSAGKAAEHDYRLTIRLIGQENSVQAFIRISRLASGAVVWAEQIPIPARDTMGEAAEIARRVAAFAMPRLRDDLLRSVPQPPRTGYDRYFSHRQRMRDMETLEEARAVADGWERLIADHPELLQAYPPLIRLYNTDYGLTGPGAAGARERRRAYELAHRAIAIDPTDSHLHTVKAWCHLWAGEAKLAVRHLEEALDLNPHHQERLVEIATGYMFLDGLDRAADLLERCRSLAVSASEVPQEEAGLLCLLREDYRGAADALALARWVHPDDRLRARPGLLTGLYALLAAAGAGDTDLPERAREWRAQISGCWAGETPLGDAQLRRWILYHNPLQNEARRSWLDLLAGRALRAAADELRAPPPGRRETPSAPRGPAGGGNRPATRPQGRPAHRSASAAPRGPRTTPRTPRPPRG